MVSIMKSLLTLKNNVMLTVLIGTCLLLPAVAGAQSPLLGGGTGGDIGTALERIVRFINNVLIPFLFAIGFFMFVWGVIKFFVIGGNNDDAKTEGKSLIIYALAGFVVILIFWGIVNILANGLGIQGQTVDPRNILLAGIR